MAQSLTRRSLLGMLAGLPVLGWAFREKVPTPGRWQALLHPRTERFRRVHVARRHPTGRHFLAGDEHFILLGCRRNEMMLDVPLEPDGSLPKVVYGLALPGHPNRAAQVAFDLNVSAWLADGSTFPVYLERKEFV